MVYLNLPVANFGVYVCIYVFMCFLVSLWTGYEDYSVPNDYRSKKDIMKRIAADQLEAARNERG